MSSENTHQSGHETGVFPKVSYIPQARPRPDITPTSSNVALPPRRLPVTAYVAWAGVLIALSALGFIHMLPMMASHGPDVMATVIALALVPVIVILSIIRWLDSWEPEPLYMYAAAFAWGGGIAASLAMIINTYLSSRYLSVLNQQGGNGGVSKAAYIQAVAASPVVEETLKGVGVLIIALIFRRFFNGPADGLVYGMIIGLGFAFTENIIYFVHYYDSINAVFYSRVIDNPFVHPTSTGIFGLCVGFASEKKPVMRSLSSRLHLQQKTPTPSAHSRHFLREFIWIFFGYFISILTHSLHNYSVLHNSQMSFTSHLPSYLVLGILVVYVRQRSKAEVASGLQDYVHAGWLTASEYAMLLRSSQRHHARNWAGKKVEKEAGLPQSVGREEMKRFQATALRLGYMRSSWLRAGTVNSPRHRALERELLNDLTFSRSVIHGEATRK